MLDMIILFMGGGRLKHLQKPPKYDRDVAREKKLSNENKELKRQIQRLQKQVHRVQTGWCIKCLEGAPEEKLPPKIENQGKKKDRTCFKCHEAQLVVFKYPKVDEIWYMRRCPNCGYRTQGKKWSDEVED